MVDFDISQVTGYIYKIKCYTTQKVYIGQCLSHIYNSRNDDWEEHGIHKRFLEHTIKYDSNNHSQLHLDIKKYGIDDFKLSRMEKVPGYEIDKLDLKESEAIQNIRPKKRYNLQERSTCNSKTKQKLYQYYNLKPSHCQGYEERQKRRKQQSLKPCEKIDIKTVSEVKLVAIKHLGEYREVRVITECDDKIYRKCFAGSDFGVNIKKARSYASALKKNYFVPSTILSFEDGSEMIETYKYQDKLNKFLSLKKLKTVSINTFYHKANDKDVCLVLLYYKGEPSGKRMMIGGKNMDIQDAVKDGRTFVKKLEKQYQTPFKIHDNVN